MVDYFPRLLPMIMSVLIFIYPPQGGTEAARILSVFPVVCKSHFVAGEALSVGLAEAGHQVTLVSPFDHKSPVDRLETVQLVRLLEIFDGQFLVRLTIWLFKYRKMYF